MKEVVVTSGFGSNRMLGGIGYTNTYENSFLGDTITIIKTLLSDSIKVYPNPVQTIQVFLLHLNLNRQAITICRVPMLQAEFFFYKSLIPVLKIIQKRS